MEMCSIEGCGRSRKYKELGVCQTHYHRLWRNGNFDDPPEHRGRDRYEDDRGYQFVFSKDHPLLTRGRRYVAEHRVVLYEKLGGANVFFCDICKAKLDWKNCHADHIDENPRNNSPENIRPLCMRCNVWRSMPPAHIRIKNCTALTFNGETKTAHEWSKDPRVSINGATIRRRKKAGMSDEEALFGEKRTHNGKPDADRRQRKTKFAYERSNSLPITIDGVTRTSSEWAREPGAMFSDGGIRNRVRRGIPTKEAVFGNPDKRQLQNTANHP